MVQTEPPEKPEDARLAIPRDDLFHLLSNRRRRYVLYYLADRKGPVEMATLAEQVAAWEHETTVAALNSTQRQRVYIPLYQNHLPKLADHDVIEYDQSRGRVEANPRLSQLLAYLDGPVAAEGPGGSERKRTTMRPDGGPGSTREPAGDPAATGPGSGSAVASRIGPGRFLTVLTAVSLVLVLAVEML